MTRNAVCLCADRNMMIPAMFVAEQARMMAGSDAYDVLILAEPREVDDGQRRWMDERGVGFVPVEGTDLIASITISHPRLTLATLFSLLVPHLLAGRYDRVLYVDCDIMPADRLAPLFRLDLGGSPLAAAAVGPEHPEEADTAGRRRQLELFRGLGLSEPFGYLNAGVLYIDVDRWNKADVTRRSFAFIRANPELCTLPDSSGLAAVLDGDFARLSPIWNMFANQITRSLGDAVRPVILHYSGRDKPWKKYVDGRRLRRFPNEYARYQDFVRGTPWTDSLKAPWTAGDLRRAASYNYRKMSRKLRGKPPPGDLTPDQLRSRVERLRRHCLEGRFADVTQGIATQADGCLRLSVADDR